jgi:hypothetical protein
VFGKQFGRTLKDVHDSPDVQALAYNAFDL